MAFDLDATIPRPQAINPGLSATGNTLVGALLGHPRESYDDQCRPVTDPAFKRRIVSADVGPFRVTGFDLAVASLAAVMDDVEKERPAVYRALGSAGMLCCRYVRGSSAVISNHAWGLAVDLKLNGHLDRRGDGRVQRGLAQIAPIFNRHGWYWGAAFRTEDAMHFEVSRQLLLRWRDQGRLDAAGSGDSSDNTALQFGDRGPAVAELQRRLNARGPALTVDGLFGAQTRGAVLALQSAHHLEADGIVDAPTWQLLSTAARSLEASGTFAPHDPPAATWQWQQLHGGITHAGFAIPRRGLVNQTLRRTLGVAREPHGTIAAHHGLTFIAGGCSEFGGSDDAINRGQPMTLTGLANEDYSPYEFFCAMRWDYKGNKAFWRERPILAVNPRAGRAVVCEAVDWGPGLAYAGRPLRRIIDLSRGAMRHLNVATDDDVLVTFVNQPAWLRLTGGTTGPIAATKIEIAQHPGGR